MFKKLETKELKAVNGGCWRCYLDTLTRSLGANLGQPVQVFCRPAKAAASMPKGR